MEYKKLHLVEVHLLEITSNVTGEIYPKCAAKNMSR